MTASPRASSYPCDLLFVHRDAERETMDKREAEIRESLGRSPIDKALPLFALFRCECRKRGCSSTNPH